MSSAIIQISDISKTYTTNNGKSVTALEGVSLNVAINDFVCLLGPSGCGKSTLLRIIAGLEKASEGQVLFRGTPLSRPTREIGMVFQEYTLLPWRTVEDNVALGLEFAGISKQERIKCAADYLEMVGLFQFRRAYPYELSGGMQQRVAIARALAKDPDVLLMDEPFGALDAYTRILLQKELLRIWEKNRKTILFVTHSVDEAIYLADRIAVLTAHPGRLREVNAVNMARPRNRGNPCYGSLTDHLLALLEEEVSDKPPGERSVTRSPDLT
ncbi:MAG: ABC transporter ATP-binding protein [Desulfatirhabdiaceae bacterium]